jgi:hypothetical protein
MLTSILHLILAFMLMVGLEITYRLWQKKKFAPEFISYFFLFFLFFAGYNLSLSLPYLFFSQNLFFLGCGYILSMVFLFLTFGVMFKLEMELYGVKPMNASFFLGVTTFAGMLVVALQILDFQLPFVYSSGLILWNANLLTGWITGIVSFLPGGLMAFTLYRISTEGVDKTGKLKEVLLSLGGICLGIAGLAYFPARREWQIVTAFAFVFLGVCLFMLAFVLPQKKEAEQSVA